MTEPADTDDLNARTLAELSALADGSLDPGREAALREQIAGSPELSRRYELERQAVEALHTIRSDRAPARLRIALDARRRPRARTRFVYGGVVAAAVAAVVVALVLLLPNGTPGAPSVSQAAALSLHGPALGAPLADRTHPAKLNRDVEEIYFPNWAKWFGFKAVGQRVDRLGGHTAVTVYYENSAGKRIAYTILAAPALQWPGTRTSWLHAVKLQTFTQGGRVVVTWRRSSHTCVLSASGVSAAELARLAAWEAPGLTS
jgi:hypothetical protein